MTRTISDVFALPSAAELTALNFVVQLREDGDVDKLVREYVLTPTVATELPIIFKAMRHTHERREDFGRFVHGSFGSGKSHFMYLLSLLFENDARAWKKDAPVIRALDAEHRGWIADAKMLVVRLHMLSGDQGQAAGLDRIVYEATNAALARRSKARFEFLHVDGVLDEARREAQLYGAAFWKGLYDAGVVGSQEDFEAMARGGLEDREALAREYLKWKGRDARDAGIDPDWATGLRRLTDHVKSQGYGGLVLMIDEFLLWLREKDKQGFERAINQLNVMVDHADGARSLPLFVFVARQRNIEEFFPDLVEEKLLHEHLGHHSKRFEKTDLEDVELRYVCKGRVLRVKPGCEAEVEAVRVSLADKHKRLLSSVLQTADLEYLKDVYPFHPALIEMLVDVSALMQRDRTALRLLYELLVLSHPSLPLGELLPVGAAFDALFPEAGIEGSKKVDELRAIHRTYHQQFKRAMAQMVAESELDEERRHVLDMIVKTALLAEVSPRLKGTTALTVERLVRLNDAEIDGETERSKANRVFADLSELARRVPGVLQISGNGAQATVSIVFSKVNFGEILGRARSSITGQNNPLLSAFYTVLLPALGLKREDLGDTRNIEWRKTRRKAFVDVRNVRELSNAEFKAQPGEVRILLDYPWDTPPHTPADDEQRALEVRRRDGSSLTVCWLPRHLTPNELSLLEDIAALDRLVDPAHDDLLRELSPQDQASVREQAASQAHNLRQNLASRLGELYRDHGKLVGLVRDFEPKVPAGELSDTLEKLGGLLLDHQWGAHPRFHADPKADSLGLLCDFTARAIAAPHHTATFTDEEARALRTLGEPLELVQLGQSSASLRLDTRYIKTVRDEAIGPSVSWDAIDSKLEHTYGLPILVRNFFLRLLTIIESFRVVTSIGETLDEVPIDGKQRANLRLQRAPLLELADWARARELARDLLKVEPPSGARTLMAQDRLAADLRSAARDARNQLQGANEQLDRLGLGGSPRARDLRESITRLAALVKEGTDSCERLREWLAAWPADSSDPLRRVVLASGAVRSGLSALHDHTISSLKKAGGAALSGAVGGHLARLDEILAAREHERSLDTHAMSAWSAEAQQLVTRLLEQVAQPPQVVSPPPVGAERVRARFKAHDSAELAKTWERISKRLGEMSAETEVELEITIVPQSKR